MSSPSSPLESSTPTERKEFLERRNRLEDSAKEAQRTADKLVVSGAGGALILSITFIDVIAKAPSPETRTFLVLAWLLFGVSLAASFSSHYTSDMAFRFEIAKADAEYRGMPLARHNRYDRLTAMLNLMASLALLLGLLFLAVFAFKNTRFQSRTLQNTSQQYTEARLARIESLLDSVVARGVRPVPPPPQTRTSPPPRAH